jgi:hypothetical protein
MAKRVLAAPLAFTLKKMGNVRYCYRRCNATKKFSSAAGAFGLAALHKIAVTFQCGAANLASSEYKTKPNTISM